MSRDTRLCDAHHVHQGVRTRLGDRLHLGGRGADDERPHLASAAVKGFSDDRGYLCVPSSETDSGGSGGHRCVGQLRGLLHVRELGGGLSAPSRLDNSEWINLGSADQNGKSPRWIAQALFERVEVLGPNEVWLYPSLEARSRGWASAMKGGFESKERQSGRGERDSPATSDLPITMRLAEPPEPFDWLRSA